MKLDDHNKIKVKAGFFLRLKFAWKAFWMQSYEHHFPYQYHCPLRKIPNMVCDNNRRESKCTNQATTALADPVYSMGKSEAYHWYHVCDKCAEKYIGTTEGENYSF